MVDELEKYYPRKLLKVCRFPFQVPLILWIILFHCVFHVYFKSYLKHIQNKGYVIAKEQKITNVRPNFRKWQILIFGLCEKNLMVLFLGRFRPNLNIFCEQNNIPHVQNRLYSTCECWVDQKGTLYR